MQDYDAAIALMPSNVAALLRKGQVLMALGKPAVSNYQQQPHTVRTVYMA